MVQQQISHQFIFFYYIIREDMIIYQFETIAFGIFLKIGILMTRITKNNSIEITIAYMPIFTL